MPAPAAERPGRAELEQRLGYRFAKPRLLAEALVHASVTGAGRRAGRSNERLEFLGDRVVGLIVASMLFERFPREQEGALARRHAQLVRKETLSDVAAALELDRFLTVAPGMSPVERARAALLADALEAVIGALYLDGGLPAAEAFVCQHWTPRIEAMVAPPRDAKTALQEWAQGRALGRPTYEVVRTEGPAHAPAFEIAVRVADHPPATASAPSKRAAEQAAAAALLARLESGPA